MTMGWLDDFLKGVCVKGYSMMSVWITSPEYVYKYTILLLLIPKRRRGRANDTPISDSFVQTKPMQLTNMKVQCYKR